MTKAFKDFDQFFEEVEDKPTISIKLFGNTYYLPTSVSANSVLRGYRALMDGRDSFSQEDELLLMVETLGEDNVDEWSKLGLSQAKLFEIYYWALSEKAGGNKSPEEVQEKETGKK